MSNPKKSFNPWRCAVLSIVLGMFILLYPVVIVKSFSIALVHLLIISTFSSINILNVNRKSFLAAFPTAEDKLRQKLEKKEFSLWKVVFFLSLSIFSYYSGSLIFGAPVVESTATLYFSILMTILTCYPLVWYYHSSDSINSVLKVFSELKFDNMTEGHLQTMILWTVLGAWFGAFPIALDWDRPWQTWPTTCCIGAAVGNCIGHFIVGFRLMFLFFRDRKKILLNRSA